MDHHSGPNTDGSSIKPVSSLRSHFENILTANKSANPPAQRQPSPASTGHTNGPSHVNGRASVDVPRNTGGRISTTSLEPTDGSNVVTPRGRTQQTPWTRSRPNSMVALSPPSPTRSPPRVNVISPKSPPKSMATPQSRTLASHSSAPRPSHPSTPTHSASNGTMATKSPAQLAGSPLDVKPMLLPSPAIRAVPDPRKISVPDRPSTANAPAPPPINRAGKPKMASKPMSIGPPTESLLLPETEGDLFPERVSPFSTPPSSSGGELSPDPEQRHRRAGGSRSEYFPPPPIHHSVAASLASSDPRAPLDAPPLKRSTIPVQSASSPSSREQLPLPLRRDRDSGNLRKSMVVQRPGPPEPPVRRSLEISRPTGTAPELDNLAKPSSRRLQTVEPAPAVPKRSLEPPKPPPPRNSGEFRRPAPASDPYPQQHDYDSDEAESNEKPMTSLSDYPDSSHSSRRPPGFDEGVPLIATGYDTRLFAVSGEYICTTGYVTSVWNALSGRMLVNMSHGETIKATALAFLPAKHSEDEGKRLWLGTSTGEMQELDIPSQSIVHAHSGAHRGATITKIFRYASEMWSVDDEGKVLIWLPNDTGSPCMQQTPCTYRVSRGHTFSIVSGSSLWIAFGKELRVYARTNDNDYFRQMSQGAVSQPNVGDVTAGATLSSQLDRIYFGHTDGKVSIYSKKTLDCLGVVNASLYKISCLVGVGDYLWAGFSSGMIYVFDVGEAPWRVVKNWKAHEKPIAGIAADRTSIWKLDRFQVVSLGTDNLLHLWDGMLHRDWTETRMQQQDAQFCEFRELSARVMTWNAGACKPNALRANEQDENFFRELLEPRDPPDILVFGFQELVDLEDKKITAKSFFKKKKSKEASEHEHMSHQYRAWRDHLIRAIDAYCPGQSYTLHYTANLVGLFSCIFVKTSEYRNVGNVDATEVKLGFSGRIGNKGALVARFFVDDSSLCFINCHLAAGQTQTTHRNNDAAAILEEARLPRHRSPSYCASNFIGGGDGSMILDHEICILNGDLNYRIDSMTRDSVISAVHQGNLTKLLERDQLLLSRKKNPGMRLRAFNEAPICFPPTYKYDVGTDTYDTSEKRRSPAWCDRLLYRGMGRIKQLEYRRHDCVKVSDHRPVSGRFKIRVKKIDQERQAAIQKVVEAEFKAVKRRIASDVKLDHLINVLGLSRKEAQKLLKGG